MKQQIAIALMTLAASTSTYAKVDLNIDAINQTKMNAKCSELIQETGGSPELDKDKFNITKLCKNGYYSIYDNANKVPLFAVWVVNPDNAVGCQKRLSKFAADLSLKEEYRSYPGDYKGSEYDRGHIVNAETVKYDGEASFDVALMSNIAPQTKSLNRGAWKKLETLTQKWAVEFNTPIYVYAGSIVSINDYKIGSHNVTVPNSFYKVLYNKTNHEYLSFIFPNDKLSDSDIEKYQVTLEQVEDAIKFKLPNFSNRDKKVKYVLWNTSSNVAVKLKKAQCQVQ